MLKYKGEFKVEIAQKDLKDSLGNGLFYAMYIGLSIQSDNKNSTYEEIHISNGKTQQTT